MNSVNCSHLFNIGLNKAGTMSLSIALARLGIPSVHNWPGQKSFGRILTEHKSPIGNLPYRAWFDVRAFGRQFPVLDWLYPEAKFIFTTRKKDEWCKSRVQHVRRNIELAQQGRGISKWLIINKEAWSREYDFKHFFAKTYFQGREEKLLVIDVPSGQGYEALCPFLDLPILNEAFPIANAAENNE